MSEQSSQPTPSTPWRVHFVCLGNIWRSRLAEAYAKAKTAGRSDVVISSSGIDAGTYGGSSLPVHTLGAAAQFGIEEYLKTQPTQSEQQHFDTADVIVFVNTDVYEDAKRRWQLPQQADIRVWQIADELGVEDRIIEQVQELLEELHLSPAEGE